MSDIDQRLSYLYNRWLKNENSDLEARELDELLNSPTVKTELLQLMQIKWQEGKVGQPDHQVHHVLSADQLGKISANIMAEHGMNKAGDALVTDRVHFLRTSWFRYAAAVVIIICTTLYIVYDRQTKGHPSPAIVVQQDVAAPSSDQAMLTLANGKRISINSLSTGQLAREGNTLISRNASGDIAYPGSTLTNISELQYNILTVPRGGRMASIYLSDGTRVFLNSASSLKYPVQFSDRERWVELVGEAYFEIAKNVHTKFIVSDGKMITEVLGTTFNVHAFPEDNATNITLLTGAVKITSNKSSVILKPGEQCLHSDDTGLLINKNVNTDEIIAWKNGYFQFDQAPLSIIAKELSRWYNVDFVFENKLAAKEKFHAKFSRGAALSELLKMLEFSDVKFQIKGNEVIIK